MKKLAASRAFWWTLLAVASAVVLGMIGLIAFSDAGNWFTVIGSVCTIIVCAIMLRRLRRQQR